MKTKNTILLLILIVFTLTSCQITEKIYFEEDGSGKYEMNVDMGDMLKAFGEMETKKIDSSYVVKDSIIDFSKLFIEHKDSIAKLPLKEQKKLQSLKNVIMVIHEDKRNEEMFISIWSPFTNMEELNDLQEKFRSTASSEKKKIPSKADVKYTFTKKNFTRKSYNKEFNEEELAEYEKSLKSMDMFIDKTTYTLEYHFPRKIKKYSIKDAILSDNKKVIFIKKSVSDWVSNPQALDVEIKFK